jgi:endonuclease III
MKIPQLSPHGLIQESLWPDEWKCLVACQLLNRTSKKQVQKVLAEFFRRWSCPEQLLAASVDEVVDLISPLGFKNRRTQNLLSMTREYCSKDWSHASELTGIGEYAARSWEMFFRDQLGEEPPKDHALVLYWQWRKEDAARTKE